MKKNFAIAIAEKLQAARQGYAPNFALQIAREPRLAEVLWSLEHAARRADGISDFVVALVKNYPNSFQTIGMLKEGAPDQSGRYSLGQCLAEWKTDYNDTHDFDFGMRPFDPSENQILADINLDRISYGDFLSIFVRKKTTPADAGGSSIPARALRKGCERFNFDFLQAECRLKAISELPGYLADVCTKFHLSIAGPRYCPNLPELLVHNLDRIARENAGQIAETELARTVRRELEFAITEGVPVPFIGESRFGKTKAIANWVAMHPGRARLVTTPNNNSEMAFMRAHADALGVEYTSATKLHWLRDDVEFVLRNSGLALVYDEAHALAPFGYTKDTPPRRLNWVRTSVVDQGVPCAFFATPQSDLDTLDRYAKKTGYRLSQWVGRMAPPVILSDVIPVEDFVAIVRTQFPELTQAQMEEIADRAILSPGYLKNIDMAGHRARFLAAERNHAKPTTQDVLDACADMMPAAPRLVQEGAPIRKARPSPERKAPAPTLQPSGRRSAEPVPEDAADEFPRRSTTPARLFNEPITVG